MSIDVMTTVWKYSCHKGGDLLTLLAIADHASDDGYAYPKIETLARKTRMTERGVQKALRRLEASKELEIVPHGGPHKTYLFRVLTAEANKVHPEQSSPEQSSPNEKTVKKQGVGKDIQPGVNKVRGEHRDTLYKEGTVSKKEISFSPAKKSPTPKKPPAYSTGFVQFWTLYPKKQDKAEAWKLWQQMDLETLAARIVASVQEHLERDRSWQDYQYIPQPAKYLRHERWTDEFPETHANGTAPPKPCTHPKFALVGVDRYQCDKCRTVMSEAEKEAAIRAACRLSIAQGVPG